jgi:gamma-D-glutamyl-L-lysine dipeptidyl-peptidase
MNNKGICQLAVIPVRKEAMEQSEMVSQLLFGETFEIIEEIDNWIFVKAFYDHYQGWIDKKCSSFITDDEFSKLNDESSFVLNTLTDVIKDNETLRLLPGSSIYNYNPDKSSFSLLDNSFKLVPNQLIEDNNVKSVASYFLNAPYLWGGRSLFGIDCSGFSQIVFKILNTKIPRDASQQVNEGETISFIADAKEGDLAFFDNVEGDISHVGILLNNKEIIHASGNVKIDDVDHQGIFNRSTKEYSHRLRVIKRILH